MNDKMKLNKREYTPDQLEKRERGTVAEDFDAQGQEIRDSIVRSLPENYNFSGTKST